MAHKQLHCKSLALIPTIICHRYFVERNNNNNCWVPFCLPELIMPLNLQTLPSPQIPSNKQTLCFDPPS